MTGPGDERADAAGRDSGGLRASHADRERVIGVLKAAFVQGMLAKDEFDQRVDRTFGSRTYAELAALTGDLRVEQARGEQPVVRPGPLLAVASAFYAGIWGFTFLPPWPVDAEGELPRGVIMLFLSTSLIYLFVLAVAVGHILSDWRDRVRRRGSGRPAG